MGVAANIAFHTRTLWLFAFSDLKTIVIPSTIFGVVNALAASKYRDSLQTIHYTEILRRSPLVLFWVLMHYLPFAINNQRTPLAITEDAINKPWRPLPSRRLSPSQAKVLMFSFYVFAQLCSVFITGGLRQGVGLIFLGTWYNNFGGADVNPLIRNAINALGYICFISGAMEVALGVPLPLSTTSVLAKWFGIISGIIMTTVHTQDMYDQEGDALRGRRTLPLVLGDGPARWITAVWMVVWGVLCPNFWHTTLPTRTIGMALALLVGLRTLAYRSVPSDKVTFLIWNIWVSFVYALPLLQS
ncbi:UbiA prenyltransferase family [Daldinia eschscholtzii]|nr:UbiA prenyltransferase family [Daldinia eschscholtzii]